MMDATVLVHSDPPTLAGAATRAIGRSDRRSNRDRTIMFGTVAVAAAGWLFAAIQFFWGSPWLAVTVAAVLAVITSAGFLAFVARGAVAVLIIGVGASAAAVWAGWSTLNWGGLLAGAALPIVGAFAAVTARRARFPRIAAAACLAAVTPLLYLLFAVVMGSWVVLLSAVLVAGGIAAHIDTPHRARVRKAARRSTIPMMTSSLFSPALLGAAEPSGADAVQIQSRAQAQRRTANLLAELPDGWFVFHSRVTEFGDLVDHIVVGPPGVVVLRSEEVPAVIDEVPVPQVDNLTGARMAVEIDGAEVRDVTFQETLCWCAIAVDQALVTPYGRRSTLAVFVTHDAQIDGGHLRHVIEVNDADDAVEYVTGPHLVPLLLELPTLGRDDQFVADLAAVVDFLMPVER